MGRREVLLVGLICMVCQDVYAQVQCSLECPPGTRRSSYEAVVLGEGGTIFSETCETHCEAISVCMAPGVPRVTRDSYTCEPVDGYSQITPDHEVDWSWATFEVVTVLEPGHCLDETDCHDGQPCLNERCGQLGPVRALGSWEGGLSQILCAYVHREGGIDAQIWSVRDNQWQFTGLGFPNPIPEGWAEEPTQENQEVSEEVPTTFFPNIFEDGERWVNRQVQETDKVFIGKGGAVVQAHLEPLVNQRLTMPDLSPDGSRVAVIRSTTLYNNELGDSETFFRLDILDAQEPGSPLVQATYNGTDSGLVGARVASRVFWVDEETIYISFATSLPSPARCEVSLSSLTMACASTTVADLVRVRGGTRSESGYIGLTEAGDWVQGMHPNSMSANLGSLEGYVVDAYFTTILQTPVMVAKVGAKNLRVFRMDGALALAGPVLEAHANCVVGDHLLNMTPSRGRSLEMLQIWNL